MQGNRFEAFAPAVVQVARAVQYLKSRKLAEHDLKGTNAMCLCEIEMSGEVGLSAAELSRTCDIDKAQISRIVNELCSKGYITEPESENVNYRKRLKLTPLGRDTAEGINAAVAQIHSFVSGDIPENEISSFYATLDLICEKLKQAEDTI